SGRFEPRTLAMMSFISRVICLVIVFTCPFLFGIDGASAAGDAKAPSGVARSTTSAAPTQGATVQQNAISAQTGSPRVPPATPAPPKKLPTPQNVSLRPSYDGVGLSATYYPTPLEKESAKEAVPVILLHQFKGSRADYSGLAIALQSAGCAVLVPDLRGHGLSTRGSLPDGHEKTIEPSLLTKPDFDAMSYAGRDGGGDVEMCRAFLMERNNAQELNIDKLCLVGAEMGAAVAINWAKADWAWPVLPGRKQGQDVKAIVLLSPTWSFKGTTIGAAIGDRDFVNQISWMIVVGEQDSKGLTEAKRLRQSLERFLPPAITANGGPRVDFHQYATTLEGAKLLGFKDVTSEIIKFLDQQVGKSSHPWTDRSSPL
ncbi:MAG TPA: alpha/beta fold hydrolase, partial [Pirellulales bacterium]